MGQNNDVGLHRLDRLVFMRRRVFPSKAMGGLSFVGALGLSYVLLLRVVKFTDIGELPANLKNCFLVDVFHVDSSKARARETH